MCLLITQNKNTPSLSDDWLDDFYSYNSDGIGVMYSENGSLIIRKLLPKTTDDLIKFYDANIKGKNCAWHLRMRTHGNIDLENCHPYPVLNKKDHGIDIWLMHNGVLATGNKSNTKKSDTWHYIKDFLRPMLAKNPDFAFHASFNKIIADHIGTSNKFVLMDNQGRMATVNKDSGYFWHGLWLSNAYAWSASKNISKMPCTNAKTIKQHSLEKPVIYHKQYGMDFGYENSLNNTNWIDEDSSYIYDEIDQIFMDFEDKGLMECADINPRVIDDFITEFDFDCFLEIANMALDQNISEEWFVRCMRNYSDARIAFPWLDRVARNSGYDQHGVNTKNSFNSIKVSQ